jgi:hypothetical protein
LDRPAKGTIYRKLAYLSKISFNTTIISTVKPGPI